MSWVLEKTQSKWLNYFTGTGVYKYNVIAIWNSSINRLKGLLFIILLISEATSVPYRTGVTLPKDFNLYTLRFKFVRAWVVRVTSAMSLTMYIWHILSFWRVGFKMNNCQTNESVINSRENTESIEMHARPDFVRARVCACVCGCVRVLKNKFESTRNTLREKIQIVRSGINLKRFPSNTKRPHGDFKETETKTRLLITITECVSSSGPCALVSYVTRRVV